MVDQKVIVSRIEQIAKHLQKLAPYVKLSRERFLRDSLAQDVVEYNLFQIVNHLIDVIQHIVVDENYGLPQTAYEAAQILADKRFFSGKDLEIIKKMIGFRNVIGHDYVHINKDVVYSILSRGREDIKRIISKIAKKFL
jgi:uncharacterized protein YutE (UPF0331/DUF86 family)